MRDWGELTALRDGMYNNLENSIMWETGGDDKEAMEKVMVFNMVREITKYREGYMMRRIEQLEKKQDKHNAVIERTYRLEEAVMLHEEKIKVANHRIDDLERRQDS